MTTGKRRIPINGHEEGYEDAPSGAQFEADPAVEADPGNAAGVAGAPDGAVGIDASQRTAGSEGPTLEEAVRERDALADSLLRLRAEFENYRRRAARESVEARDRAQGELLGDLLPVLDNLERALDAAEHHDEGKVLGGVRLTRDLFLDLLRRAGVEEIETAGAHFDPMVHDAMLMQPSDHDEGIIVAVLERGYRQGERVLRPARVAVSSGPGEAGGSARKA